MNTRFVVLVLSLVLVGCPPPPPPDFRALAEKAYADGATQDKPALDKLWSSLFKLKKWYFLMSIDTMGAKQPSVSTVDGEQWVLAFTDEAFLGLYAGTHRTLIDGGPLPTGDGPTEVPNINVLEDGGSPFVPSNRVPVNPSLQMVHPHLGKDGKPLFVAMSPDDAVKFLNAWSGPPIKGVRFNEGSRKGWFAPASALPNIRDMLKANGKL